MRINILRSVATCRTTLTFFVDTFVYQLHMLNNINPNTRTSICFGQGIEPNTNGNVTVRFKGR